MTNHSVGSSNIALHQGEAMLKLAGTYPTLQEVVEEAIQNSLDSRATEIQVRVNKKTRHIAVRDNGCGVSPVHFQKALNSVGKGIKREDSLGRFGLGLISPLGKCTKFTFISCYLAHRDQYVEWTFETEKIKRQQVDLVIPTRQRQELFFDPERPGTRSGNAVWWRTAVEIFGYTTDRHLSAMTPNSLAEGVMDKYSPTMKKLGTNVRVTFIDERGVEVERVVSHSSFLGRALPECKFWNDDSGETIFRIFVTRRKDRRIQGSKRVNLQFGEIGNDFRFSYANFRRSVASQLLSSEILDDLGSGLFEGEILSQKTTLTPKRTCFEQGDALVGLCVAIEEWHQKIGSDHLNQVQQERQDERYQSLGVEALKLIKNILARGSSVNFLADMLRATVEKGTTGNGHFPISKKLEEGVQEDPSLSVNYQDQKKEDGSGKSDSIRPNPKKELKDHVPLSVSGPKGKRRRIVRDNSLGLQISFDDLEGVNKLWEFERETGVLIFNITHPHWVDCDTKDWKLRALMEHIILQALALESAPDPQFKMQQRLVLDIHTEAFVCAIANKPLGYK